MEHAVGGELFDYIVANTKLTEREACKFFQQIIAGVEYVHKLNIVHRDLKPENLLLDKQKNIKIVDFGLSNIYKPNELLKTACGSPCYAAPEMIAGKKYVGLRVDLWSCGVILYAMLCGYLPFDDQDTQILYKKIMNGDFTIPDHVSPEGRDILKCILNTNPNMRYTIPEIRRHPWYSTYRSDLGDPPKGIIVGYHKIPVDNKILNQVSNYGYEPELVRKHLEANKHNRMTTLYYLLLLKAIKNGYTSPADIASPAFVPDALNKDKKENLQSSKKVDLNMSVPLANKEKDATIKSQPTKIGTRTMSNDYNALNNLNQSKANTPMNDLISSNHHKIETRTKKPNIAHLNDTTLMSIDNTHLRDKSPGVGGKNQDDSIIAKNNRIGVGASTSPKNSSIINNDKNYNTAKNDETLNSAKGQSANRGQQNVLANKMKDLNKHAIISGKRQNVGGNTNYMNFGSIKDNSKNKVDIINQSLNADANFNTNTESNNKKDVNFNKSMDINFNLLKERKKDEAYASTNSNTNQNANLIELKNSTLSNVDSNIKNKQKNPSTADPKTRHSKENSNKNSDVFSNNNVRKVNSPKNQSVQQTDVVVVPAKENTKANTSNVLRESNNNTKGNSLISGMKVHKGPLNLSSISMKDPIQLMKDIIIVIEELTINYKITSRFSAKCEKGNLKFLVEINFVENFTNLFAIKFYKSSGDNSKYADLCSNIFSKISL